MNLTGIDLFKALISCVRYLAVVILFSLLSLQTTYAQKGLQPRLEIGLSLLPAVIAANKNLNHYLSNNDTLSVYLVYQRDIQLATAIKSRISKSVIIQKQNVKYQAISQSNLLVEENLNAAAIFIIEPAGSNLKELIGFSHDIKSLLFSPFKGDVEQGVATGFQVTDRVLPMVNIQSLEKTKIKLKAFFLRIAVKYEKE